MTTSPPDLAPADLAPLRAELGGLRAAMLDAERAVAGLVDAVAPDHGASARNLVHYLALRRHDAAPLQESLRRVGLSSLGRAEPVVLATIDAVLGILDRLEGDDGGRPPAAPALGFDEAERLLRARAAALLGPPPAGRDVSIMVTMPTAAAEHAALVGDLAAAGMDVMRINAAHDDPGAWARMVDHLGDARGACRVLVDLPGPKLRTSALDLPLELRLGDRLLLLRADAPGHRAVHAAGGGAMVPATIGCQVPAALDRVEVGHRAWFDDGRLGAVVRAVDAERVELEITSAGVKGRTLRGNKGINLPDTEIGLPALGDADDEALAFAARHADAVALSFVRGADDVAALHDRLDAHAARGLGVVVKIETRAAFDRLPEIMLAAMRGAPVGVMIARGDLAVEVGYERLAEVQEEILWMCEAAHLPVVWATQVLEGLAKKGTASRAEITDAAMAQRAECVMLNKGPYILHAVRTLDDILRRMRRHQSKKRPMLRPLAIARRFLAAAAEPPTPAPDA